MKKPNITEGEWLQYGAHVALSGYEKMIANCVSDIPDAECLANAKAISAVPNAVDDYKALLHAIRNNKTDNGAIILGDKLEQSIRQTAKKMGFKYE